jgi:hypothetical protein
MKVKTLLVLAVAVAGAASAEQVIVGGTQSAVGFPFYGC